VLLSDPQHAVQLDERPDLRVRRCRHGFGVYPGIVRHSKSPHRCSCLVTRGRAALDRPGISLVVVPNADGAAGHHRRDQSGSGRRLARGRGERARSLSEYGHETLDRETHAGGARAGACARRERGKAASRERFDWDRGARRRRGRALLLRAHRWRRRALLGFERRRPRRIGRGARRDSPGVRWTTCGRLARGWDSPRMRRSSGWHRRLLGRQSPRAGRRWRRDSGVDSDARARTVGHRRGRRRRGSFLRAQRSRGGVVLRSRRRGRSQTARSRSYANVGRRCHARDATGGGRRRHLRARAGRTVALLGVQQLWTVRRRARARSERDRADGAARRDNGGAWISIRMLRPLRRQRVVRWSGRLRAAQRSTSPA
jgi:hypothetical protein